MELWLCLCLAPQSCLTFCNPLDCSLPGSSVHRDSLGKNTGVCCHALLSRIFPTQGSNTGLPYCGQIVLSEPPGKPKNIGVGSLSLLQEIFPTQESNQGLLHCRQILYQLSYQGSMVVIGDSKWLMVKNLPAMQKMPGLRLQSLGQEDPLEKKMATHWSILAWRIP